MSAGVRRCLWRDRAGWWLAVVPEPLAAMRTRHQRLSQRQCPRRYLAGPPDLAAAGSAVRGWHRFPASLPGPRTTAAMRNRLAHSGLRPAASATASPGRGQRPPPTWRRQATATGPAFLLTGWLA